MLLGEIIAVCCENHTEHINTLCGQSTRVFNTHIKAGATYSYQYDLKELYFKSQR
jgi:hypothetical protein